MEAWIGLALALVAGTAAAAPRALPSLELGDCPAADSLPKGARCGVFHVAEDPSRRPVRVLDLKVFVLPARSAHPLEPIFVFPGGPGEPAAQLGWAHGHSKGWTTDEHPVVLMNPRGSDPVTGLVCPADKSEDLQRDVEPAFAEGDAYWRACRDALAQRFDLTRYTTALVIEDYDALRRALGYYRIDILGGSFGTRLGLAYIHAHGEHVRAAVLTGLSPLEIRSPLNHAASAQRGFDRLVADCVADAACHAAFPTVREDLAEVLARLERDPARVTVKDPRSGQPAEVLMDAPAFANSIRVMLYSVEDGRRLPRLLHKAVAGDLSPFAQAAVETGRDFRINLRLALTLSEDCVEDTDRIRPEEVAPATAGSFIGDTRVRGQMADCALWPKAHLPAGYFAPFRSQVPAVLVSGELDPVTPPHWGEVMRAYLPNSLHLVTRDAHAGINPCIAKIAAQVFRTASVQGVDTSCVATDDPLPRFEIN